MGREGRPAGEWSDTAAGRCHDTLAMQKQLIELATQLQRMQQQRLPSRDLRQDCRGQHGPQPESRRTFDKASGQRQNDPALSQQQDSRRNGQQGNL